LTVSQRTQPELAITKVLTSKRMTKTNKVTHTTNRVQQSSEPITAQSSCLIAQDKDIQASISGQGE